MTCNELHNRLESGALRTETVLTAEVVSHIEHCSACRHTVDIEERLREPLRLLRNSVPAVSATLDESILSGYRARLQRASAEATSLKKQTPLSTLVWRAAIAAVLLVGAILLFGNRKATSPPPIAKVQTQPAVAASARSVSQAGNEAPKAVAAKMKPAPRARRKASAPTTEVPSAEAASLGLPSDFRNLMYCDQLSCSGAMDVIRMNLPASSLGMASPLRTSNVVAADVLVGPDGVARAIRIVN